MRFACSAVYLSLYRLKDIGANMTFPCVFVGFSKEMYQLVRMYGNESSLSVTLEEINGEPMRFAFLVPFFIISLMGGRKDTLEISVGYRDSHFKI